MRRCVASVPDPVRYPRGRRYSLMALVGDRGSGHCRGDARLCWFCHMGATVPMMCWPN
ncbi:hypothetical protein I551_4823 [Mycobacterium ulcerans str. Harvey]|uniref:Uncharacterized protein n=1 Tax=Mycobacterium ulcerans str. Harvey TaxID=1299332 RepID=A0ABN0QVG2_MYCUL|nr:hypothetical protein I551_4823 [Mycobacterium ulcerans str. Harvey]